MVEYYSLQWASFLDSHVLHLPLPLHLGLLHCRSPIPVILCCCRSTVCSSFLPLMVPAAWNQGDTSYGFKIHHKAFNGTITRILFFLLLPGTYWQLGLGASQYLFWMELMQCRQYYFPGGSSTNCWVSSEFSAVLVHAQLAVVPPNPCPHYQHPHPWGRGCHITENFAECATGGMWPWNPPHFYTCLTGLPHSVSAGDQIF